MMETLGIITLVALAFASGYTIHRVRIARRYTLVLKYETEIARPNFTRIK